MTGTQPGARLALFHRFPGQPGRGMTGEHAGSKRGYTHATDVAADPAARIARAQEWSARTGCPVPPHLRPRAPLPPVQPLSSRGRLARYAACNGDDAMFACPDGLLPPAGERHAAQRLTPAQERRMRHKHGRREVEALRGLGVLR